MIFEYSMLFFGVLAIALIQYIESLLYLKFSETISEPKLLIGRLKIGISWLLFGIMTIVNCILGIVLANHLGLGTPAIRTIGGAAPVAIGIVLSIVINLKRWKSFQKKFNE